MVDNLPSSLYEGIRSVLSDACKVAYRAVNFTMVQAYWTIGKLIVEHEQNGKNAQSMTKRFCQALLTGSLRSSTRGLMFVSFAESTMVNLS